MIDQSLQLTAPCTFTKFDLAKIHRSVDLISDALSFGRLWYGGPDAISNAVDYAKQRSRSHDGGWPTKFKPILENHAPFSGL